MKDPVRLVEEGELSESERILLRAGASEQPPVAARAQLLAALGLDPAAAPSDPGSAASSAAGGAGGAGAGTGLGKAGLAWISVGGIGAVLAGALLWPSPQADLRHPTADAPSATASEVVPSPAAQTTKAVSNDEAAASAPDPVATGGDMEAEIALVRAVRIALRQDAPERALALLDAYDAAHPRGALRQEAARLRVEGLARTGATSRARARAQAFLRAHPDSPHAPGVRAILKSLLERATP